MLDPLHFTATLPMPPSANALFHNLKSGGRAKTAEYKRWIEDARYHLLTAWRNAGRPEWPDKRPMAISFAIGLEGRRRDCSNCIKAVEDLIVKCLPVPDDKWNDQGAWTRDDNIPGLVRVTIHPLPD